MDKQLYWSLFCNPKDWDIKGFIESNESEIAWKIREEHYDKIKPGHLGIIRVGKDRRTNKALNGRVKLESGVYAIIEILKGPQRGNYIPDKWSLHPEDYTEKAIGETPYVKVLFLKKYINLPLRESYLKSQKAHGDLYKLQRNSSMPIQQDAFNQIIDLACTNEYFDNDIMLSDDFPEGKVVERVHKVRERNMQVVQIAKDNFKKENNGKLFCQVCGFSFENKYGNLGKDFIEGHHTIAVSEMKPEHKTKPEDIAMLCANCHRMVHKKRPWLTMGSLSNLLK